MRSIVIVVVGMSLAACESSSPASCKVSCTADSDCPDGQACGDLGMCTSGQACPCEAGVFLGCDGDIARSCNATADGVATETCAAGCNATAGRCNACVPSSDTCSADETAVEHCGADGLLASTSTCRLPCVAQDSSRPAHCGYLEPLFFPDLCDATATSADVTLADVTLDTSADATCTGGILTQTGGPEVCVVRAPNITLSGTVVVRGRRAIAFVGGEAVLVQGVLDASADGTTSGAGGGAINGERTATAKGGGGAGFGAVGGAGGTGNNGAGAAGVAIDPLQTLVFVGGTSSAGPTFQQGTYYPLPGGGGGAVMLVACRGTIVVSGTIDVGGGGGESGRDTSPLGGVNNVGGTGGGSGGYIVLQGIEVTVSAGAGVYANGGGGGGGCDGDACVGGVGGDAPRSALGGNAGTSGNAGPGGAGGGTTLGAQPGGANTTSPGGGGGAVGRLQVCRPDAGTVSVAATTSPAFLPEVTISTR